MSHNISPSLTYFTPYDNLMDVPACMLSHFSRVQLFVTLSTVARQAPLSVGFSRQEYWSGLPWPSSTQRLKLCLFRLLHWQAGSL